MAYNMRERNTAEMFKPFVETMKQFVKDENLSNAKLSEALGQDQSYISTALMTRLKNNKNPAMSCIEAIADYFDAGIVYKNGCYYMAKLPEGVN